MAGWEVQLASIADVPCSEAVNQRLDALFEALETGLLAIDDLASRTKALRQRQQQLQITRSHLIDEQAHLGQEVVTLEAVRREVGDLEKVLDEGSLAEQRQFIKSFVRGIEVSEGQAILRYTVPILSAGRQNRNVVEVLPIVRSGGAGGTFSHSGSGSLPILANAVSETSGGGWGGYIPTGRSSIGNRHFTRIVFKSSAGHTRTPSLAMMSARSSNVASSRLRSRSCRTSSLRADSSTLE